MLAAWILVGCKQAGIEKEHSGGNIRVRSVRALHKLICFDQSDPNQGSIGKKAAMTKADLANSSARECMRYSKIAF